MRILLDTNIILSGLLSPEGPPAQLLQAWLDGAFDLVTAQAQLDELQRVFTYPRIRPRVSSEQARDFLGNLAATALLAPPGAPVALSPDPDDNLLLAAAIAGRVDAIVSGDKSHMLALARAEGIPIVTAREALDLIRA